MMAYFSILTICFLENEFQVNLSPEPAISVTPSPFSTVMAGDTVTLTCSLTLFEELTVTPDLQWVGPGGVTLTGAYQVTIGQTLFSSVLQLHWVRASQAGEYNCTAILGRYTTSNTTTITVQSKCHSF